jgi:PilZ domain-containing protein
MRFLPCELKDGRHSHRRIVMTEELNEGTAYLRALKQATGALSGAAAAPAREQGRLIDNLSTVPGSESFQGAEKRRSPRYKCEGSVQLREEGCDVRTWSTFTDISLNGCYVEAQATYPAGTLLHMKLESNVIRVEIKGKVRISYPYLGMGIAFEEISEENANHLKQLLASLSVPASSWDRVPLPHIQPPDQWRLCPRLRILKRPCVP